MNIKENSNPIYQFSGVVIHGQGKGKIIGIPTINLKLDENTVVSDVSVYAAKVLLENQNYYGAAHLGTRPTVGDFKNFSLETHILNFNKEIYNRQIKIQLFLKIRDIQKFDNLKLLVKQIKEDCLIIKKYWGLT